MNHGNNFLVCKPVLTPTAVQCVVPSTMRLPRFCPVTDIVIAAPPLNIFVLDYTKKHLGDMPVRGGGGRGEGIPALTGVAEALAKILI